MLNKLPSIAQDLKLKYEMQYHPCPPGFVDFFKAMSKTVSTYFSIIKVICLKQHLNKFFAIRFDYNKHV